MGRRRQARRGRGHLLALAWTLCAASARAQPTITITSLPPYAVAGPIAGRVAGVDFATHRVAVYIQIEGAGWWTKPSFSSPTVPIRADGTFSASFAGGGLDDRATIFCVALLAPGVSPPRAAGSSRVPASLVSLATDYRERYGRRITFAGHEWAVKEAPLPAGPGSNVFSDDPRDVWVDAQGRLHLTVHFRNGRWWATEVMSVEKLGFGTFWFTTESELEDLDVDLTFGAFTWDPYGDETTVPGSAHREIDFEDSRWGRPAEPTTSQVVVQPYHVAGNLLRFTLPDLASDPTLTRFFTWTADRIEFAAARGRQAPCSVRSSSALHRSVYLHAPALGHLVPTQGRTRFHFNLWIQGSGAPRNGQAAEVIVSDFRHSPVAGAFVGGCGVNPRGSLRVIGGSTSLGRAVVVGIDNPVGSQPAGSLAALLLAFAADPAFPCGTSVAGWGMLGGPGELQVDTRAGLVTWAAGLAWGGAGSPVRVPVAIPRDASLVGRALFAQGAIVDPSPGAARPVGITDAMEICVRP